jgi:hypothetical protein
MGGLLHMHPRTPLLGSQAVEQLSHLQNPISEEQKYASGPLWFAVLITIGLSARHSLCISAHRVFASFFARAVMS